MVRGENLLLLQVFLVLRMNRQEKTVILNLCLKWTWLSSVRNYGEVAEMLPSQ